MAEVYKIIVTGTARTGMKEILDYLVKHASLEIANKVRKELNETIRSLKTMPSRNGIEHDISNEQTTYRRILKWSYKIVYTIEEDAIRVVVVDISHAKQDPEILIEKFKN